MTATAYLLIIPSGKAGEKLINWSQAQKFPWGIIFSFQYWDELDTGFSDSGPAAWIGEQLPNLENLSLFFLIVILIAAVNFLKEVISNLATTGMLLPILAPMALAMNLHPHFLLVGATLAASCAFLLLVATPSEAVVFGSGYLRIPDMIKAGIWMNLVPWQFLAGWFILTFPRSSNLN